VGVPRGEPLWGLLVLPRCGAKVTEGIHQLWAEGNRANTHTPP